MKKLLVLALIFVLGLGVAPTVSDAATKKDCSSGNKCQGIEIVRGDRLPFATNPIYVPKGDIIRYGGRNNYSDGQFQVSIELWSISPSTLIATQVIPYGLNLTFEHPVTVSGDYIIIIKSGDDSQGRSHAYGWLSAPL